MSETADAQTRPLLVWAVIALKGIGLAFGLWGYIAIFGSPPGSELRSYASDQSLVEILVTTGLFALSLLEIIALFRLSALAVPLLALDFVVVAVESIGRAVFGPADPMPAIVIWGGIVLFSGLNFAIWRYAAHLKKTGALK